MGSELVKAQESQAHSVSELERMGKAIAASGLFGIKTTEQAVALMLVAQSEGRHPATVAREYDIIQGRPAIKAEAKLARFQEAGGVIEWEEMTDTRCAARFSHPAFCPKPVLIEWTLDMARKANLTNKDNWKSYPRAMLRSRVISEGVRAVAPGTSLGMYTPEEVMDFDAPSKPPVKAFKIPSSTPPPSVVEVPQEEGAKGPEAVDAEVDTFNEPPPEPEKKPPTPEEIAKRMNATVVSKSGPKGERMSTEAQQKCIHAMSKSLGIERAALEADLTGTYGSPHTADLTFKQASGFIDSLKGMLKEKGQ